MDELRGLREAQAGCVTGARNHPWVCGVSGVPRGPRETNSVAMTSCRTHLQPSGSISGSLARCGWQAPTAGCCGGSCGDLDFPARGATGSLPAAGSVFWTRRSRGRFRHRSGSYAPPPRQGPSVGGRTAKSAMSARTATRQLRGVAWVGSGRGRTYCGVLNRGCGGRQSGLRGSNSNSLRTRRHLGVYQRGRPYCRQASCGIGAANRKPAATRHHLGWVPA